MKKAFKNSFVDQYFEKLKEFGQHSPGTLEEMIMRVRKFSLYPQLYQRLKLKAQGEYRFQCSPDQSPSPSLISLSRKSKFDLTWEVVKEGKLDLDLTFIKNISRGHHYEDEAINKSRQLESQQLGMMFQENLSWEKHIDQLICTSYKKLFVLKK